MNRLRKFRHLSYEEKRLFILAVVSMSISRVALLVWSLPEIVGMIARTNAGKINGRKVPQDGSIDLHRAARIIDLSSGYSLLPTTCLSRTMAAYFVLSRLGYSSTPGIGVSKVGGKFAAHAWLECEGGVVIGTRSPDGDTYQPLGSLARFFA